MAFTKPAKSKKVEDLEDEDEMEDGEDSEEVEDDTGSKKGAPNPLMAWMKAKKK